MDKSTGICAVDLLEVLGHGLDPEGQGGLIQDALGQLKLLWLLRVRK